MTHQFFTTSCTSLLSRVNSWENLEKIRKSDEKKLFSKSAKNVFDMVIGPVEFRKTGYFATWWRFVAREHDFTPKMKVFSYK